MAAPRPRPSLQVVREGNPGHRPVREGLKLPPAELTEPDWLQTFPKVPGRDRAGEMRRARFVARREWRRVVPVLQKTAGLGAVDAAILHDLCVIVARLDQAERDISRNGIWVPGERGAQKNPCVTAAAGYRTQLKAYIGELGLSPSSRTKLTPPEAADDDGDDAFD